MKNNSDSKDAGRRVAKVEKQVHETIATYLLRGFRYPLPGIVTLTRVIMPADLRSAKVYVSVISPNLDSESKAQSVADEAVDILSENAFEIQEHLGKTLKMRYCPKLHFFKDNTTEQVLKVEKILQDLSDERSKKESK